MIFYVLNQITMAKKIKRPTTKTCSTRPSIKNCRKGKGCMSTSHEEMVYKGSKIAA
jgi:hypothetical protein